MIEKCALQAIHDFNLKQPNQTFLVFKKENAQFKLLKSDRNFENLLKKLLDDETITDALNFFNTHALLDKI